MTEKKNEPLKKITIKEFQWYEVETKVRELLTELLQPFTKKQTEESIKMNQIKRTLASATQKLEDHDFLLTRQNSEKPTYIQQQDKKIEEISNNLKELSLHQGQQIREMRQILEIYQDKVKQINSLEGKIQKEQQLRIKQAQGHKQYVNQQIDVMLQRLDNHNGQINNIRVSTRNSMSKLETKSVVFDNRINQLDNQMKRRVIQIGKINENITKINEKGEFHQVKIQDLILRTSNREKDQKLSERFFGKTMELANEISFLRNYLTFYQPLYNQMQISETIHSFLKGTQKTRVCLFQEKVFATIHHNILTMQNDSLEAKMSEFGNRIRRIINRNKKYVIKLKIQQTIRCGTNIYEIREIDERMLDEADQVNAKPATVIIPEHNILQMVEDKWEKLIKGFQTKIQQKINPVRVWMQQLQEQALMRMVETDKVLENYKKQLQKLETNISLYQSQSSVFQKQTEKRLTSLDQKLLKSKQSIRDLTNFSSVINHIVIQDEIDRQGLALYALRSAKGGGQPALSTPNIKLDEKCISCNDPNSSTIINQTFKMACLAYNPSEIKIDDKLFSREEILQISTSILQRLKNKPVEEALSKKNQEYKKRSKSSINRNYLVQPGPGKIESYRTIDSSSKRRQKQRETATLLPTLGSTSRRKQSEKNSMGGNSLLFY